MSDTPIASRPSLGRVEWGALVAAIVLGHVFYWRSVLYPSAFDASEYLTIAADLARTGLFGDYRGSQIRTYGYPLFLLGNRGVAELLRLPWTYVVFASQLALYLGAAILVRRAIAGHCEIIARIALVALVLNPFPLVYAAETLTECLSITLLLLAAGAFIATWRASGARRAVAIAAVAAAAIAAAGKPIGMPELPA